MKKTIQLVLTTIFVTILLFAGTSLFAQVDSTSATVSATEGILGTLVTWLEAKWAIVGTIGTALFVLSEILASIPSLKANSVVQGINQVLAYLFGKKTS